MLRGKAMQCTANTAGVYGVSRILYIRNRFDVVDRVLPPAPILTPEHASRGGHDVAFECGVGAHAGASSDTRQECLLSEVFSCMRCATAKEGQYPLALTREESRGGGFITVEPTDKQLVLILRVHAQKATPNRKNQQVDQISFLVGRSADVEVDFNTRCVPLL